MVVRWSAIGTDRAWGATKALARLACRRGGRGGCVVVPDDQVLNGLTVLNDLARVANALGDAVGLYWDRLCRAQNARWTFSDAIGTLIDAQC